MKKKYIIPTTTVVRLLQRESLLISSVGNDKGLRYGGGYEDEDEDEDTEEPRSRRFFSEI